jgi:hypothetical protein
MSDSIEELTNLGSEIMSEIRTGNYSEVARLCQELSERCTNSTKWDQRDKLLKKKNEAILYASKSNISLEVASEIVGYYPEKEKAAVEPA